MHLTHLLVIYSALLLTGSESAMNAQATTLSETLSLNQLEERLERIDAELGQLAKFSLRGGMGAISYRSARHSTPEQTEWVQIDLDQTIDIDQIVLVPTIWHNATIGYRADGFPLQFRILAGTEKDKTGSVIAAFDETDHLLPRIAPLIVPCAITASWVRIETSLLSPAAFDGKYNLELAEIMIFSGEENIALRKSVQTPSQRQAPSLVRRPEFLVDGHLPYLMHAGKGEKSIAFIGEVAPQEPTRLTIDLGATYSLNRIHLHSVELSDTVPQSHPTDFGLPRRMIIEGANTPDFSHAIQLVDSHFKSIFESGPIIIKTFPDTPCRYIRATIVTPYIQTEYHASRALAGFAEIEFFSNGRNVALNQPVQGNFKQDIISRSYQALTDGRNIYGQILPIRAWINELAQRHDLEVERPLIAEELNVRYAHQKTQLKWVSWLAALMAVGIGFTILIDRILQVRKILQVKERFAADLHDELGANIHTIEMLNEISRDADSQDERDVLSDRISQVTARTATSIRHFTNRLEADTLPIGLVDDMQRATERIATNIEYDISVEGADSLSHLKPLIRADLFLFYKESLINIIRHSGATKLCTRLEASAKEVRLSISDNGIGITDSTEGETPAALKRRARLIGAKVTTESSTSGGTTITLILRPRRPYLLRKRL